MCPEQSSGQKSLGGQKPSPVRRPKGSRRATGGTPAPVDRRESQVGEQVGEQAGEQGPTGIPVQREPQWAGLTTPEHGGDHPSAGQNHAESRAEWLRSQKPPHWG